MVYIGDRQGRFFAINAASGKEIARHQSINWVMGSACVDGDIVYVGRMDWWIYAYRAKTLEVLWKYKTRTSVLGTPVGMGVGSGGAMAMATPTQKMFLCDL